MQHVYAQAVSGTITGTVADPAGGVVANAKVTVKNQHTGLRQQALTDTFGACTFTGIPPGTYRVTVTAPGFKDSFQDEVVLEASKVSRIDIELEMGSVAETMDVTAETALVETESAEGCRVLVPLTGEAGRQDLAHQCLRNFYERNVHHWERAVFLLVAAHPLVAIAAAKIGLQLGPSAAFIAPLSVALKWSMKNYSQAVRIRDILYSLGPFATAEQLFETLREANQKQGWWERLLEWHRGSKHDED